MFQRLVKAIKGSFYDKLTIREAGTEKFLGEIFTNCIPRTGEDIQVVDTNLYKIIDVVYRLEWDRIGGVDLLVEKRKK